MKTGLGLKKKARKVKKALLPNNAPNFIIIGAQKAGTSSLHNYLSQHPDLFASDPKEIHYFDKWINFGYSLGWYENHFSSFFRNKKLFFESSPNYIYCESVAQHISKLYPNIKMILILRNPATRAFSAWNMFRELLLEDNFSQREGRYPGEINPIYRHLFKDRQRWPTFKEAISIELNLMEKNISTEPSFLRRGMYAEQISKYLKYFKRDQILIIGFKDFTDNLDSTLNKVYDFLNIKRHSISLINTSPRNKREYKAILSDEERLWLENFYNPYNVQLFKLLKRKINW